MNTHTTPNINIQLPAQVASATDKQRGIRLRRLFLVALVIVGTGVALRLVIPWAQYRQDHIVSHEAAVQGTITPVGARIDGQVVTVNVKPGQQVKRGDVLATLDAAHLEARAAEADARVKLMITELEAEQATLKHERNRLEALLEQSEAELTIADARLGEAETTVPRWKKELERTVKLQKQGFSPDSELDRIAAEYQRRSAAVETAKAERHAAHITHRVAEIDLVGLRARESRLAVLQAQINVARAAHATALAQARAARVVAPADGWVRETHLGPGASVRIGQPILSLWLEERLWVEAWIDEDALPQLSPGGAAQVSLDALPGIALPGRVETIGVMTDLNPTEQRAAASNPLARDTARLRVRVAFDAPKDVRLIPGLSAVVGITKPMPSRQPLVDTLLAFVD